MLYDYIVVLCPHPHTWKGISSKFPLILWCRCTHVVPTILIYARGLWFHARSRIVGARRDTFHSVDGEKFSCHKWHQDGVSIATQLHTFQGTSDITRTCKNTDCWDPFWVSGVNNVSRRCFPHEWVGYRECTMCISPSRADVSVTGIYMYYTYMYSIMYMYIHVHAKYAHVRTLIII